MNQLILPKFLTKEVAERAVNLAYDSVFQPSMAKNFLNPKREQVHIVIYVPAKRLIPGATPDDPVMYALEPYLLHEQSFGRQAGFEHPFDLIARSKGLKLWHGQDDGGTDIRPHLLFPGDTPYWGGEKRAGIASASSGIKPQQDRLLASLSIDYCITFAYEEWLKSDDRANEVSLLT